jgi:glycosyltransferase involved in cell wall biosynthesis
MRIAFDGTTLTPRRTGVGYYTEHLLHHLAQEDADNDLVVLSNQPIETTRPLSDRVRVVSSNTRAPRLVWMQTTAPRLLRRLRADIVHFTNGIMPLSCPIPSIVTIHDMSLTMYPAYHPSRRVLLNRPLVDVASRRAASIITVSESARRDIVRLYRIDPGRVHVVHEAAAPAFRPVRDLNEIARVRRRYGLADRVILYVGTIEPRKNLPLLVQAFAACRRRGDMPHQLVCVGPYGWRSRNLAARIDGLEDDHALLFPGYVPFEDLPTLYSLAEMFVFPSMYEGFGLPVIEAMACGTPVIIGPVPALIEIGKDAVERVDRLDAGSLGAAMVRLAADQARRTKLAASGLARARVFSWSRAARETLEVYRRIVPGDTASTVPVRAFTHTLVP